MGQYYMPYIRDSKNKVRTLYSHEFDSGLKLTEHSWIGNHFCNQVYNYIKENPMSIAWIGDYAGIEHITNRDCQCISQFDKIKAFIWSRKKNQIDRPNYDLVKFDFEKQWYLVNITKHIFLDMKKYISESTTEDGWCISPLSLLTAVGNGEGGGDYWGVNKEKVGEWAFDEIMISAERPQSTYSEFSIVFKE